MNLTNILQVAEQHFFAKNYHDVKLDNIAHALKIKKPSFYHYFHNKKDFYIQTLQYSLKKYLKASREITKNNDLDAFVLRYLEYPRKEKNLFAIAAQTLHLSTREREIQVVIEKWKQIIDRETMQFLKNFHIDDINIYLICHLIDKLALENCIDDYCLDYCVHDLTKAITTSIRHCMR